MKKIIFLIGVVFLCFAQIAHANPLESAFDKMSYIIFKAAWPTATYDDYEIFEVNTDEKYIVVKMNGKSAFSDGKLVVRLKVLFTRNYGIKDVKVIKHNAILSPPFNTLGALSEILEASSSRSSSPNYASGSSSSSSSSSSSKYYIHVKNNCHKKIKLAVHYKSSYGSWKNEYWYAFEPYETGYLSNDGKKLTTNNSILYFYAKSYDGTTVWKGSKYTAIINDKKIHMDKLVDEIGDSDLILSCAD